MGRVRAVHDHPDAVHLVDDRSTELGQPRVLVVAAAARLVVEVVGEQCLAHAQSVIQGDHSEVSVEGAHALEVEGHRQPSLDLRPAHVVGRSGDEVAVGGRPDEPPVGGEHGERLLPRRDVIGDVERDEVDARLPPVLETGKVGPRVRIHARMGVPHDCRVVDLVGTGPGRRRPDIRHRGTLILHSGLVPPNASSSQPSQRAGVHPTWTGRG